MARVSLAEPDRAGRVRGVEQLRKNAGHAVTVPFTPGRNGRLAGANRCGLLRRARADRGRLPQLSKERYAVSAEELLVDKAN